jgi:DNA invertase Pin-like site-specific DNA recombinase
MTGAVVGYARCSTGDQRAGLDAQIAELRDAGCTKIFDELISSVDARRPKLEEALAFLREGDVFVVTRPDRLARSTKDLLDIVDGLTKRGVAVRILSMDLNTANATGRLILTILAGIAEFERSLMLERQRHGIAKAKAQGKYRGRSPTARIKAKQIFALKEEGIAVAEIVRRLSVSRSSVHRILNDDAMRSTYAHSR